MSTISLLGFVESNKTEFKIVLNIGKLHHFLSKNFSKTFTVTLFVAAFVVRSSSHFAGGGVDSVEVQVPALQFFSFNDHGQFR